MERTAPSGCDFLSLQARPGSSQYHPEAPSDAHDAVLKGLKGRHNKAQAGGLGWGGETGRGLKVRKNLRSLHEAFSRTFSPLSSLAVSPQGCVRASLALGSVLRPLQGQRLTINDLCILIFEVGGIRG